MTTILITGALRGIGAHSARHLAATGATVYAGARRPEQVQSNGGEDLRPIALDVTDDASATAAVQRISSEVGALDVLVNNAGIPGSWAGPAEIRLTSMTSSTSTSSPPPAPPAPSCRC